MFKGLFNITFIAEVVALAAATVLLNRKTGLWRWFIVFLLVTVAVETTGWVWVWKLRFRNNTWIYNLRLCIDVCFSLWILSRAEVAQKFRRFVPFACLGFVLLTLASMIFFHGWNTYNSNIEILNDIVLAVASCYLLFQLLREKQYRNLSRYEYFWLANGLLVFCLVSAVLSVSRPQLYIFQGATGERLSQHINDLINILFYASLITAFVCRQRNTLSST